MAPKELRGRLSGLMTIPVTFGQWLANLINIFVENTDQGWRISNTVSTIPPVIVMCGIFCVPESPRWMYQHKGREMALGVLKRLRRSDNVRDELDAIGVQITEEETGNKGLRGLWESSIRRRIIIAMVIQLGQQATGISPIMTYSSMIFKDITSAGVYASLLLSGVNFISSGPSLIWLDKYGRRYIALIGAVGMVIGHLFAAILFSALLGVVGSLSWIYCSEIFLLNVRASTVSMSTAVYWVGDAIMTEIVKLFPYLNINGVFFLFAGLGVCCGLFIYFFCPETKGILLEDVKGLFDRGYSTTTSPSFVEVKTPVERKSAVAMTQRKLIAVHLLACYLSPVLVVQCWSHCGPHAEPSIS